MPKALCFGSVRGRRWFIFTVYIVGLVAAFTIVVTLDGWEKFAVMIIGLFVVFWLRIVIYWFLKYMCLNRIFPVTCGHRRYIFTGKSSRILQDILLTIDAEVQSEEEFKEAENETLKFTNDIKAELEKTISPTTAFECFIVGSVTERCGIPYSNTRSKISTFISGLETDLDVMYCFESMEASFSGERGVLIEPIIMEGIGHVGFAQLKSLTSGSLISSKDMLKQVKDAVQCTEVTNLPETSCSQCCYQGPGIIYPKTTGPAIKVNMFRSFRANAKLYEVDVTVCIKCCEWPPFSDWPTRQRCWPSQEDVSRIVSHGCHLVAKPAPFDKEQTSWRFSFSVAEVELSKLIPNTARKCFLALKVILKDHLQPVVYLSSYHLKTIFVNTLEKTPVDSWVDENIEKCFFTLLKEVYNALYLGHFPHHWFRGFVITLDKNKVRPLIRKLKIIGKNPAPYIFDDGCCCLSPCCTRLHLYEFPDRYIDERIQVEHVNESRINVVPCQDPSVLTASRPEYCPENPTRSPSVRQSVVVTVHSTSTDERQPILDQPSRGLSKYGAINS